jgi:hypothetical protein
VTVHDGEHSKAAWIAAETPTAIRPNSAQATRAAARAATCRLRSPRGGPGSALWETMRRSYVKGIRL